MQKNYMMKKLPTLHILNGDASLPAFSAAKIPGLVLVWREVLSEGPAVATVPEQEFWKMRQEYITSAYNEPAAAYKRKVLDELPKVEAAGASFEVVLWFDADLMCQINLLYLLFHLHQLKPAIVSVCTPEPYRNIGQMQPEALSHLYGERHQLKTAQLEQASKVWQVYAGPDPMQLQHYLQQHEQHLPHLKQAMLLHLSRFPECNTGLGLPEKALLRLLKEGANSEEVLMQRFWQLHPAFGFGDAQIRNMLKFLQPELVKQEKYKMELTELGEKVTNGKAVYTTKNLWLGGARIGTKNPWCYHVKEQQLQIIL
jgi:hypothetical protein